MDVTISNMCWMPKAAIGEVNLFLLKKNLTLVPKVTSYDPDADEAPVVLEMYRETETHIGVPRAYYFQKKKADNNETFKVSSGRPLRKNSNTIQLRADDQEPAVAKVLAHFKDKPFAGGIIEAFVSFGKTTSSIKLAEELGRTTIILVHKNPLKTQWMERIKQFYPTAKIGVVQGPECDYEGKDFVIAMAQSIMLKGGDKYPPQLWDAFGLVIVDEIHKFGSRAFCTSAMRFTAKNMLGLSATPYRADGCEDAFRWVIGQVIAKPQQTNQQKPIVYIRETGFEAVRRQTANAATGEVKEFDMNKFPKPTLLGFITRSKSRNNLIASDVLQALKAGRSPLVMSERLDILHAVSKFVEQRCEAEIGRKVSSGFYIGGKKQVDLDAAAKCDVIYATLQLAKEGIDIAKLDTLFMCTPVADPTQPMGRVGRAKTVVGADGQARVVGGSKPPMVVDYVDSDLKLFKGIYFSRLKLYKRLGFKIIGKV